MSILETFFFQQPIIIDRIEEDIAIVEWENLSLSLLPIELFATPPKEGQRYLFSIIETADADCLLHKTAPIMLKCQNHELLIPIDVEASSLPPLVSFQLTIPL